MHLVMLRAIDFYASKSKYHFEDLKISRTYYISTVEE